MVKHGLPTLRLAKAELELGELADHLHIWGEGQGDVRYPAGRHMYGDPDRTGQDRRPATFPLRASPPGIVPK